MPEPDRVWLVDCGDHGWCTDARDERVGMGEQDPVTFVRADWALAWIKDRHLAWCRGEANETALGFDDWITEQWAAAGREADR